jgi:hypothetical protein
VSPRVVLLPARAGQVSVSVGDQKATTVRLHLVR